VDFFVKREKSFKSTFLQKKFSYESVHIFETLKWIFFFIHFFQLIFFIHFFNFSFKTSFSEKEHIPMDYFDDFFLKLGFNENSCILQSLNHPTIKKKKQEIFFIHFSLKTTFCDNRFVPIFEKLIY